MTEPSKPDLVGFLLGALDNEEHAQTERAIDDSNELGLQAGRLRRSLKRLALDCRPDHEDVPPRLAERTCRWIWEQVQQPVHLSEAHPDDLAPGPRRSLADMVVAACVLLIAFAVFLPALEASRFQAGVLACQQKLQEVGMALHNYSDMQPDHSFPRVEPTGNRAAAGIYAPVLVSNHLIENAGSFFCPKSDLVANSAAKTIPSLEVVDHSAGEKLKDLQARMGGSYAYSLGHLDQGNYVAPVNLHRENFALLGDAPPTISQGRNGQNVVSSAHRGQGHNIFFEDGHTQFFKDLPTDGIIDHPYVNRQGFVAAGTDLNDAVLGRSADSPFTPEFNPQMIRVSNPR